MSQAGKAEVNRQFTPRKPDGPRRVRHGIKFAGLLQPAQAPGPAPAQPVAPAAMDADASGQTTASPSAQKTSSVADNNAAAFALQLIALMEARADHAQLSDGLHYARSGQVVSIDIGPGEIRAQIQGSAARPYDLVIAMPTVSQQQWQAVVDAMSGEAMYAAKLLAGELPPGLDALLERLAVRLLPADPSALRISCTCGTSADDASSTAAPSRHAESHEVSDSLRSICKHTVAATHIAAERLVQDPLLIFTLAGKPAEQLLEALRRVRVIHTHGAAAAHGETSIIPEAQVQGLPLEACIDDFWRVAVSSSQWAELDSAATTPHVPHALLRRLGPSPLGGRFPLVGLLASVYDTVSAAARRIQGDDADASDADG